MTSSLLSLYLPFVPLYVIELEFSNKHLCPFSIESAQVLASNWTDGRLDYKTSTLNQLALMAA